MWFVTGALAAPTLEVVGDDLLLFEHLPAIEAAWRGEVKLRRVTEVPTATHFEGPAPEALRAVLPPGTPVATAPIARLTLGLDMDRGAPPSPAAASLLYGRSFELRGFVGRELEVAARVEGCCGSEHFGEHLWRLEPGALMVGYLTSLGWESESLFREARYDSHPNYVTSLLMLEGRRVHLAARADPPRRAVVFGQTLPGWSAPIELTLAGVTFTPDGDGWRIEVASGAAAEAICDRDGLALEVVVPGPAGTRRARLDPHRVLCDNMMGAVVTGARVAPVWAADGSAGALWVTSPMPMLFLVGEAFPLPVALPAVELLAGVATTPTHPASVTIRELGFPVVRHGATRAGRASAQVFHASGLEAEAALLAKALGATVGPLDWKAAGEIVVALP